MIKINKNQIHRFRKIKEGYLYPLTTGVYLGFNNKLEYVGVEMFYYYGFNKINQIADEKIADLLSKDLLVLGEEND